MNAANHFARQLACILLMIRPIGTRYSRSMASGQNRITGIRLPLPAMCSARATSSKKPGRLKYADSSGTVCPVRPM